ncbi:hypothetical protein B0H63DRAFT_476249 [Podospora didyma]|uniref:SET domain-containing protein n=1 Tax=Podospora didyma TaxID=330526 RepID=A0AAE0NHL1_9PEZI|nr:hypothetical protein B0H63DRAFT_476249 [Podospora didyma]
MGGSKPKPQQEGGGGGGGTKSSASGVPKNWPAHIPYLTTPLYSPKLTAAHLAAIRIPPSSSSTAAIVHPTTTISSSSSSSTSSTSNGASSGGGGAQGQPQQLPTIPRDLKPGPSASVRITPITNPSHPANGQFGLFAARNLRPGELILPYLGEIHPGSAADAESDYDLWLDRDGDVAVDAARVGNEARFVNDYRGVPDLQSGGGGGGVKRKRRPNAEFRVVWDPRLRGGKGEKGMGVFVLLVGKGRKGAAEKGGIGKGEEVLVSYGKGFWGGRKGGDGDGEGGEDGDGEVGSECG